MISDYYEQLVMDSLATADEFPVPTTLYLALFSTPIRKQDNIGSGPTELTGSGYVRTALSFAAWAKGLSVLDAYCPLFVPTATLGPVVATALCDASTAGNIVFSSLCRPFLIVPTRLPAGVASGRLRVSLK